MRGVFLRELFWTNQTDSSPEVWFCRREVRAANASASLSRSEWPRKHTNTLMTVTFTLVCVFNKHINMIDTFADVSVNRRRLITDVPSRLSWRRGCRAQMRGQCWTRTGRASCGPRWEFVTVFTSSCHICVSVSLCWALDLQILTQRLWFWLIRYFSKVIGLKKTATTTCFDFVVLWWWFYMFSLK